MSKENPQEASQTSESAESQQSISNELRTIIGRSASGIKNIGVVSGIYGRMALEFEKKHLDSMHEDSIQFQKVIETGDKQKISENMPKFIKAIRRHKLTHSVRHSELIKSSMFLSLFSFFDAFTGDLLKSLYKHKPELHKTIKKQLTYEDTFECASISELRERFLEKEIESLKRESYVTQFENLGNRFGLKTLCQFKNWPKFIECSQRRNLITHCDGVVSQQYLSVCKSVGHDLKGVKEGDKLKLPSQYLNESTDLIVEVILKLGHVLWKKIFPELAADAERFLMNEMVELMHVPRWELAEEIGKFALDNGASNDAKNKMFVINLAQVYKWQGKQGECEAILDKEDWSCCSDDFKLAVCILKNDFPLAAQTMKRIGEEGAYISRHAYFDWPLFTEFRKSKDFLDAYKEIYNEDYQSDATQAVANESAESIQALESETKESD